MTTNNTKKTNSTMKTYAYIRVSSNKQTVENQRFEINHWCESNNIKIDEWVEETISGTKDPKDRKLGGLLDKVEKGDLILCSEISRLGRSLFMVMEILSECSTKEVQIRTIKDNFVLDNSLQSKALAFAFSLCSEIERELISKRTKEALDKKRAEGVKLGRPVGSHNKHTKLDGKEEAIKQMLLVKMSYTKIAEIMGVNRTTLVRFCKSRALISTIKSAVEEDSKNSV